MITLYTLHSKSIRLFFLLILVLALQEANAQRRGCDENPGFLAACFACSYDCSDSIWVGSTNNFTPGPRAGWCGSIENDQYIAFLAQEASISWSYSVPASCPPGGLQFGIYNLNDQLIGSCTNQVLPGNTGVLTANNLNPCEAYLLRVDGYAGVECNFELVPQSGIDNAEPQLGEIRLEGNTNYCFGSQLTFSVDNAGGGCAMLYNWNVRGGRWLKDFGLTDYEGNPSTQNIATLVAQTTIRLPEIPVNMPGGTCDTAYLRVRPQTFCFQGKWSTEFPIVLCKAQVDTFLATVCEGDIFTVEHPTGTRTFTNADPIGVPIPFPAIAEPGSTCLNKLDIVILQGGVLEKRSEKVILRGNEEFNPCDNADPPIPATGNYITTCIDEPSSAFPCGREITYEVFRLDPVVILGPDNFRPDDMNPGLQEGSPSEFGLLASPSSWKEARQKINQSSLHSNCLFAESCDENVSRVLNLRIINSLGQVLFNRGEHMPGEAMQDWGAALQNSLSGPQMLWYWMELEYEDGSRSTESGQLKLSYR